MSEQPTPVRSDEKNRELLRRAYRFATASPDLRTQTGAYLATPTGADYYLATASCNDFPDGVEALPERLEPDVKADYIEHAERNAIYKAARNGSYTSGTVLVATWLPCVECARAIIQAGIVEVLVHESTYPDHWKESLALGAGLLSEAGVKVTVVEGALGDCGPVQRMGESVWP
jgi:dCMP deaminase